MKPELRVPKRRVTAQVRLVDGSRYSFDFFLAESTDENAGPERLSDLLNVTQEFIPAIETGTGAMILLARDKIVLARVPPAAELTVEAKVNPVSQEVELHVATNQTIRGQVTYELPQSRSRMIDFLNITPTFISVATSDLIVLVNKHHVIRAVPLSAKGAGKENPPGSRAK